MIGILERGGTPSESLARAAQAAVPHPTPTMEFRALGSALIGIATRPDFVNEFISAPGDLVAVVSGRLDNAAELYAALAASGQRPASRESADVVVAAFRAHGPLAVNRFRGAFAGIVTDGSVMHSFRDHIGFRPLFFRDDSRRFVAAGEARPVAVAAEIAQEPDLEVLRGIVFFGMPSHTPSALKGVMRQPQTSVITAGLAGGIKTDRYWFPWEMLETERGITVAEASERFLALLEQAVVRAMVGRSAVFLSGGLDSPAIAAMAAREGRRRGEQVGGLAAVFPDLPDVDEEPLIRIVAERFGMDLHLYRPKSRTLDDAVEWARRIASPAPTLSLPEVFDAYQLARAQGYTSVMTGEFAELTYGKFPHLLPHLLIHGRFGALLRMIRSEHRRGAGRLGLVIQALTAFVPGRVANWWVGRQGTKAIHVMPEWVAGGKAVRPSPRPDFLTAPWRRWTELQLGGTEGSTITMEADAITATMAGVVSRRPFADVDLWEFFLRLPAEVKFPTLQWKALARQALVGVIPDEILQRKKKVHFDSHVTSQVDAEALRRLLVSPRTRIAGVDYDALAARLDGPPLGMYEWIRLRDLAKVHAFLEAF